MQAGRLRHPISIQAPSETQDTSGQMDTAYEDMFPGEDIRAEIVPLSGREFVAARQVNADVTTRITIRRYAGVRPDCRVVRIIHDDSPPTVELYDIVSALPDPVSGQRYITLMCIQRFAEGWRRGDE